MCDPRDYPGIVDGRSQPLCRGRAGGKGGENVSRRVDFNLDCKRDVFEKQVVLFGL